MEDSLEDYLKISRHKTEESIKISKEEHLTAQRKKECDTRAMKIVEFAIEGKLRPEIFTKCLPYITQSHYQDIVEERAVTKLCGYSVCGRRIPEMPRKQYYISTKNNKVYDITDRKNYCSNFCYKASLHIKKQIDDSPLWLRKLDDIPEYSLLESGDGGLPGEYIDQGVVKPASVDPSFTSISTFADASLKDMIDKEKTKDKVSRRGLNRKVLKPLRSTMQTINENAEQICEEEEAGVPDKEITKPVVRRSSIESQKHLLNSPLPVIEENEEKTEIENVPCSINSKENSTLTKNAKRIKKKHSKSQKTDIESLVKKILKGWLTIESYIFLYGENKIKEILDEKKLSDYFEELNIADLRRDQQAKYMEICKRLQLQEMADEKFDNSLLGKSDLKPIPDYQKLKEENKELNLKVKCFYTGALYEKEDSNFPAKINKGSSENKEEEEPPPVIPMVDVNSQNALRRKILLTSLNKSVQQLLQMLRVQSYTAVLSDIQSLVKTFKLKANNIVFKPLVWNYITVALLNILSIKDTNIKNILEEKSSKELLELYLNSSSKEFLNDIMAIIHNIDGFVEQYVSSC